jgi:hypothetical protein
MYVVFFVALIIVLGIDWLRDDRLAAGLREVWSWKGTGEAYVGQALAWFVAIATVVTLLPAFPYRSYPLRLNWAMTKAGLKIVPTNSVVLTYPYPAAFVDIAMLWQALDGMKFKLLGGYALIADPTGQATAFPSTLNPSNVEAMLVNSITPIPDPHLPGIVATGKSITATNVTVIEKGRYSPQLSSNQVTGKVQSIDLIDNDFVVDAKHYVPVTVNVQPATTFSVGHAINPTLAAIAPGMRVQVSGPEGAGTVNATTTAMLRSFVLQNHVNVVIVQLGRRDSGEIARWFRDALGQPTRAGAGGEIWLNAQQKAKSHSG